MGIAELGIQPQSPLKQTFAKRPAAVSSFTEATVPKNPVICVICGWGPMTLRWIAVFCVTGAATIVGTPQSPAQARLTVVSTDIASNAAVKTLIATLRDQADEFVFLSGGASGMSDEAQRQLIAMFEALTQLAKGGRRLAVGDGGTYAGIMRAAGEARRGSGNAFLLLGVAPAKEIPPRGKTPVDPNHSHIIAVDNPAVAADQEAWGSETETMYWLFDRLAAGRPSVTVVANGGGITLNEVGANVKAGRTMILIEGSGRAADALVSLVKKTMPATDDVKQLRARAEAANLTQRPELFLIVSLREGASGLRAALTAVLDRRP